MNGELALRTLANTLNTTPTYRTYGVMLYHDHGGLYEGRFVNGKRHGRGKLVIDDEDEKALPVGCAFAGHNDDVSMDSRISLRTAKE